MANSTIPNLVAVSVPALTDLFGVRQSGDARDKKLTVTQLLTLIPSGGDVTKVGTPVDNELGVWTGDGTLEGDTNLQWSGSRLTIAASGLILPAGSAAGPSQVFTGSLATGWYTPVANVISASIAGVQRWSFQADKFNSAGDGGALNFTATDVIPGCIPRGTDLNTGMGGNGADTLTAIAGGVLGQFWNETNAGVLSGYASSPAVTAFATGGQGGATVLINSYNIVTTVATTGDSVRLQGTHDLGSVVYCKNEGANSLDIFPASGDDLGAGVDTAVAIPAGEFKCFITTVAQSTWTELLPVAAGGGGDVTKVGTPVDNQLGVWTGDGTIEGTTALAFDGSTFTMNLGGGDFRLTGKVELQGSNRPAILDASSSLTVPTLIPLGNDPNTGIGGQGSDQLALVCGSVTGMYLRELSSGVLFGFDSNVGLTAAVGSSQGDGPITASYNVYSIVANAGDAATLPAVFLQIGIQVHVKNDGAESMDVFPASGDDLGQGTNVALAVPAGTSVAFLATGVDSIWTQIQFSEVAGGGDVIKVGTPVNNQLGVWTGDGTLEGAAGLIWSGTIFTASGTIRVANNGGGAILNEQVTSTNPSIIIDVGDVDTGFGSGGTNNMAVILGAQTYATWRATGAGDGSLEATYDLTTGKTASTTQTQGQATQNSPEYSEVTTVANPNDVITLGNAAAGRKITVVNSGANVLQIFPSSGGDLGQGVNASTTLAVGHSLTWLGKSGGVWAVIGLSETGTGDVTKVGTPANNQIGVWTGDGTIEGDANFLLTGTQLILPTGSSAGLPELKIGSGQTGFFTASATQLRITVNGTERFTVTNDIIQGFLAGSGQLHNRVSSFTVPTFTPNTNDSTTGIGGNGSGLLSGIAAGAEIWRAGAAGGNSQLQVNDGIVTSPGLTFITDLNTGIGRLADDALSLIAGGVEIARCVESTLDQLLVISGVAAGPGIGFLSDPDTGFFLANTGTIEVSLAGTSHFEFLGTSFGAKIAGGARIVDELPSATNPSFVPNKSDTDTGIGWTSADILSLIAGAVEGLTIAESGGVITLTFRGDLQAAGGGGAGPVMRNVSASPTVPTLIPNQADPDTGLTRDSINGVSMVGGGLGCIRGRNIGGARAVGFYTTTPIIQQTGVAVTDVAIHAALVALGLITA